MKYPPEPGAPVVLAGVLDVPDELEDRALSRMAQAAKESADYHGERVDHATLLAEFGQE